MLQPGSGSMPENIGFDPNLRKSPQEAKPGEGRCGRKNEKGARIRFQRSLFRVIPARFERATRSLEGCCSIQLSYGTIGKTAPCGDDLRRKDRNFFHNSPRLNEKYRFPQGCNGLQPHGNPVRARPCTATSPPFFRQFPPRPAMHRIRQKNSLSHRFFGELFCRAEYFVYICRLKSPKWVSVF